MSDFNERIKNIRIEKGLSQVAVSKASGILPSTYGKIESGKITRISIEDGIKISKGLDVSFNELFEIEEPSMRLVQELEREIIRLNERIVELEEQLEDKKDLNELLKQSRKGFQLTLLVNQRMLVNLFNKLSKATEPVKITEHELRKEAFEELKKEFPESLKNKEYNPFTGEYIEK